MSVRFTFYNITCDCHCFMSFLSFCIFAFSVSFLVSHSDMFYYSLSLYHPQLLLSALHFSFSTAFLGFFGKMLSVVCYGKVSYMRTILNVYIYAVLGELSSNTDVVEALRIFYMQKRKKMILLGSIHMIYYIIHEISLCSYYFMIIYVFVCGWARYLTQLIALNLLC